MYLKNNIKKLIKERQPFIKNVPSLKSFYSKDEFEKYVNTTTFVLGSNLIIRNKKHTYIWNDKPWSSFENTIPNKILDVILKEETTLLINCDRASKTIIDFISEVQDETNMITDCHMFYCSKDTEDKGLGRHHDYNDNFMIHIFGKTKVTVWGKNKIEKVLRPGDIVYVPRKVDHLFESKTERLSLSFPMLYKSKVDKEYNNNWITI